MVPITKGMPVPDAPDLVVMDSDGQYGDLDLINCETTEMPGLVSARFAAQYIRYGKVVYQFDAPEDLGKAIVDMDPESSHDAAQLWREELARKVAREKGTLTPENPAAAPDAVAETEPHEAPEAPDVPSTFDPLLGNGPAALEESIIPEVVPVEPEVLGETTPIPEVIAPEVPLDIGDVSSTTPAVDLSTTTPE